MFVGACVIIIGSIVAGTADQSSNAVAQFVVGRWILGAGILFMTVAAPAYAIEISPPLWRGRATGLYNCGWFGGQIPAAFIGYGFLHVDSNWSWKAPVILQCFASAIVFFAVWFIPETPRYLMAHDQDDKAIDFLIKYHGNGDPNSRLVQLEIEEIRANIQQDRIDNLTPWWDYRPLFRTRNASWRSAQVLMMAIFGQFSGNGLGYYNNAIFAMLGAKSPFQQLGYNMINTVLGAFGALTAMSLTDCMPRRKVLVPGTLATAGTLALNAGLMEGLSKDEAAHGGNMSNKSLAQAALSFYFLFNLVYSFAYSPLQGVVPAEALGTTLRAKGLAMYGLVVNLFGFINTYCTPIALQNIQNHYIWVFVGWDCIEAACWYFFGYVSFLLVFYPPTVS